MKKFFLTIIIGGLFLAGGAALYQAYRIYGAGRKTDYTMKPFERHNSSAHLKILFLGDSTAVGTGARSNIESTAGWFGQDFPNAMIVNFSLNGRKLDNLLRDFHPKLGEHYHLVVAQIGANDIMRFTSFHKIKSEIIQVIDRLQPIADTVVILHSGNVGLAPVFSWPFDQIMTWRSRVVRDIYIQAAHQQGVLYVDLFSERYNDLFLKDIGHYYSPDRLHPSGAGYRWWYDHIRQTLEDAEVKIRD